MAHDSPVTGRKRREGPKESLVRQEVVRLGEWRKLGTSYTVLLKKGN